MMFFEGFSKRAGNILKGGKGDGHSTKEFSKDQVEKGREIEKEHTPIREIQDEILTDHLTEDPKYYDGPQMKKELKAESEKKASEVTSAYQVDDRSLSWL